MKIHLIELVGLCKCFGLQDSFLILIKGLDIGYYNRSLNGMSGAFCRQFQIKNTAYAAVEAMNIRGRS